MPESQAFYLLKLLLIMKYVKFLWIFIVIFATCSNHIIFPIVDNWLGNFGRMLSHINAEKFFWNSIIMVDINDIKMQFTSMLYFIEEALYNKEVAKLALQSCDGEVACFKEMLMSLYGRFNTSKYVTHVSYGTQGGVLPNITCLVAYGADLNCPYVGHLVASTKNYTLYKSGHTIGTVEFFSFTAPSEKSTITIAQRNYSKCARHENFHHVMSKTVLVQTVVLLCSVFFYFLVGTISCIVDLKKNGFMTVMFRKGLSVKSFWLAVWLITGAEILLITVLFTVSLVIQCIGFYSVKSVIFVCIVTLLQLYCIAAIGFLFTIVLKSFFHIGLVIVTLAISTSTITVILRLAVRSDLLRLIFAIILPIGHLSEYTQANLLTVLLPDAVTYYHHIIPVMSILFGVICNMLTFYLDFILTTGNGYCLKKGYILEKRFWTTSQSANPVADPLAVEKLPQMANIESNTGGLRPIVRVSRVSKHFESSDRSCSGNPVDVLALNDLTVHIYADEITAIIGHNGSGKTTLLNILNGIDAPTSGRVSVNGVLVSDSINRMKLHKVIGICMQDNSLTSALTVMQTIKLALISSNMCLQESAGEVQNVLKALQLLEKRDVATDKISGGMKRKLCTAVALIGEPKLLCLDEPTSGVDLVSRGLIWKLLQEYKKKCSIILSTQSMDEADTLADRKIFLSGGSLICAGSSLFLKSAFDCGFNFNVTLKSAIHAPALIKQIRQEFNYVKVRNTFPTNIDFYLPAARVNELPVLAQAFERRADLIAAFGLLQVSLYDIFARLSDARPEEVQNLFKNGCINLVQEKEQVSEAAITKSRLSEVFQSSDKNSPSALRNFRAIVYINLLRMVRSRVKLGSRIIVPIVLLLALLTMAFVEKNLKNAELELKYNLTNFGEGISRGVCLYDDEKEAIDAKGCAAIFQNASLANASSYLSLAINANTAMYDFLHESKQIDQIKTICKAESKPIECPVVYCSEWKMGTKNSKRIVKIGSFSSYEQFNSSFAASVTIGAYYKLSRHFLAHHLDVKDFPEGDYKVVVNSVYDFRTTFITLYGTFVQLLILSILPATFMEDLIEDKETLVRTHLSSMGLGTFNYWITVYLVHWIQFAITYLLSGIILVAINSVGYLTIFYLAVIALPTLILGLSNNLLFVYVLSSVLKKCNTMATVVYFFFSILLVIVILSVQLDNVAGLIMIGLLPPFTSIALTFYGVKTIFYTLSYVKSEGADLAYAYIRTIFSFQPHILGSLVAMVIHCIVLLIMFILLENRQWVKYYFRFLTRRNVGQHRTEEKNEDPGVQEEIQRLGTKSENSDNILEIRHLKMRYSNGARAVRDVTLGTSPGDIFGLLGPNGAGKSTTMAIIVGDLRATSGRCEVRCDNSMFPSGVAARKGYVGYCPQYNPQYPDITVREHLEFYSSILGVPPNRAKEEIEALLQSLRFEKHADKPSSELPYGFKRRLSLAAALLGDPSLLVIDEASTGVDPEAKRILWDSIRALACKNRCIMITTHSMEEVEALCNRVCIMNYGSIVGLGSVQQLKSRYGQFNTLEVLLNTSQDDAERLKSRRAAIVLAVSKMFPNSTAVEEFGNRVIFSIPQPSVGRLSVALSWLNEIKTPYQILHFSFYQMSMDQVFARMITLHNGRMPDPEKCSVYSLYLSDLPDTNGI